MVGTIDRLEGETPAGSATESLPPAAPELQIDGRLGDKSAAASTINRIEDTTLAVSIADGLPPAAPELHIDGRLRGESVAVAPSTGSRARLQRSALRTVFHPPRSSSRFTGGSEASL